ncbi:MAG: hypothetical protein J6N52_12515 [Clostridia bacterium]|nr:hypothetical protein [Clostridia bacterium]
MRKKILQVIVICFEIIASSTVFAAECEIWPISEQPSLHRLSAEETEGWSAAANGVYGYTLLDNGRLFTSDRLKGSTITFSNGDSERTVKFESSIRYDFEQQQASEDTFSSFEGGTGIFPDGTDGDYMAADAGHPAVLSIDSLSPGGCCTIEFDAMKSVSEASTLLEVLNSEGERKALAEMRRRGSSAFYLRSSDGTDGTVTDNSNLININDWFHVCVIIDFDSGEFQAIVNDGVLATKSKLCSTEDKTAPAKLVFELNIDNLCVYRGKAVNTDDVSFSIEGGDYAEAPEDGFRYSAPAGGVLDYNGISGRITASGDLRLEADGASIDSSGMLCYKRTDSPVRVSGILNLGEARYSAEKTITVRNSGEAPLIEQTVIDPPILTGGGAVSAGKPVEYIINGYNPTESDYEFSVILCLYNGSRCVEIDVNQVCLKAGSYENSFSFSYTPKSGDEKLTAHVYVLDSLNRSISG